MKSKVAAKSSSVSPGKPTITSAPMAASGSAAANQLNAFGVMRRAIPAMHGAENAVRPGLQRHVKMRRDARRCSDERDEILGDVLRLDGAEAQLLELGLVQNATHQIGQLDARRQVAPVAPRLIPLRTISFAPAATSFRASSRALRSAAGCGCGRERTESRSRSSDCCSHPEFSGSAGCDRPELPRCLPGDCLHDGLRENIARKNFGGAARERHWLGVERGERNKIARGRRILGFMTKIRDRADSARRFRIRRKQFASSLGISV